MEALEEYRPPRRPIPYYAQIQKPGLLACTPPQYTVVILVGYPRAGGTKFLSWRHRTSTPLSLHIDFRPLQCVDFPRIGGRRSIFQLRGAGEQCPPPTRRRHEDYLHGLVAGFFAYLRHSSRRCYLKVSHQRNPWVVGEEATRQT
jgi:hypothetical protein